MATMDCQNAVELLPWLVNGTLEPNERAEVIVHVRVCPACRAELEATNAAFDLFAPHPAAADLVALAFDHVEDRKELEAHLASCAQCREELELVRANLGLEALVPSARPSRLARPLPLAAAAAAVLVLGLAVGTIAGRGGRGGGAGDQRVARLGELERRLAELEAPRLNIPVVELFPTSSVTRGGEELPKVDASGPEVALILATELRPPLPELRLDLVDAEGTRRFSLTGLERQPTSDFTVLVPRSAMPAGDARIELVGLLDGEWRVLETYRLRVSAAGELSAR